MSEMSGRPTTSHDPSPTRSIGHSTPARTRARQHRKATVGRFALIILSAVAVVTPMVWMACTLRTGTPRPDIAVAIHTITVDCMSAEEIARAYGWSEDWRDYMIMIEWHNRDLDWGRLHYGDRLLVPDYRSHTQRHQQLGVDPVAASGCTKGRPGVTHPPSRLLSRPGPPSLCDE